MFKNKTADGRLNLCGKNLSAFRKEKRLSQRAFADKLQLLGLDISKNAIQQIESGERFVTDIELQIFAKFLQISIEDLLS